MPPGYLCNGFDSRPCRCLAFGRDKASSVQNCVFRLRLRRTNRVTIIRGMENHLLTSLDCLERVVNSDDVLVSASQALSTALAASVAERNLRRSFPTIVAKLSEAIERAAPELARVIAGEIPANEVEVGLQALRDLLADATASGRERRQLHVGLLSSQLNGLHCHRELESRGGPLSLSAPANRCFIKYSAASVH